MKKQIMFFALALFAIAALAQSGGTKLLKTTTVTIDTVLVDTPHSMGAMSDSVLDAKLNAMQKKIIENNNDQVKEVLTNIRTMNKSYSTSGKVGNFLIAALKNMMPIIPFVAAIFIAFFWFKNNYRRRMLRQELIFKYIDRGETVPEWLTRGENILGNNEPYTGNRSNAKTFLVVSIVLAGCTFIWALIAVNTGAWGALMASLAFCVAFGLATIYCFRQYVKRTE